MSRIFQRPLVRALSYLAFGFWAFLQQAQATHIMGVDITYECIGNSNCQFRIYHKEYFDCGGGATSPIPGPTNTPSITFTPLAPSAGCGQPTALNNWTLVAYVEVTPICPNSVTKCTSNSATINGVVEQSYYRDYDFCTSGAPGSNCSYQIEWSDCCRNQTITSGSQQEGIYSGATIIKPGQTPCNSSPMFLTPPVPYLCTGEPFTFTQEAYDPDGDSLVYSFVNCMSGAGTSVTYNTAGGYSPVAPLGPLWDVQMDPLLGDVTVTPMPGNNVIGVLCIEVAEYDPITGQLKGKVVRDIQFTVITGCTGAPPAVGPIGSSDDTTTSTPTFDKITLGGVPILPVAPRKVKTCIGSKLEFEIPVIDTIMNTAISPTTPMQYTLSWNGNTNKLPANFPAGATFVDARNPAVLHSVSGTRPVAKFSWTPTKYGTFVFQVRVKDQSCPITRTTAFSIIIQVDDALKNTNVYFHPQPCSTQVTLNADAFSSVPSNVPSNVKFFWQGTGNLDTLYNPGCTTDSFMHYYPGPGQYQYTVQIKDTFGCAKTITRIGTVGNNAPTAAAGSDISICAGYNFQLGGTMPANQTYTWTPATYLNNPTLPNPMLSVPANNSTKATVKYTLKVTDNATGCETYDYVTATVNPNVVANITSSVPAVCPNATAVLTANVANSTGGTTYLWSNNASNATTKIVNVNPATTTTYSVIAFENGCASAPAVFTLPVTPGPTPQITGKLDVCSGLSTQLAANAPAGSTYQWVVGGAPKAGTPTTISVTNVVAPVNVTLTATNSTGCAGDPVTVQVTPYPVPVADFLTNTPCAGSTTNFSDLSAVAAGSTIVGWNWSFGDGTTSNAQNPVHTYAQANNYNVSLTVVTDKGCVNPAKVKTATVKANPVADFSFANVCEGAAMNFQNTSSAGVGSTTKSLLWTFGEASVGNQTVANPSVIYPTYGPFNVTLKVTNSNDCEATRVQTVFVHPKPIANFTYIGACEDSLVKFSPTPTVVPGGLDYASGFQWSFTLGMTSPETSIDFAPGVAYDTFGTYTATLEVTTNHGCRDDVTLPVLVYAAPHADFRWERPCENEATQFISLSTSEATTPITKWTWDVLADSNWVESPQTIKHNYMANGGAGVYRVRLAIQTNANCLDTIEKEVVINPAPRISFDKTNVCQQDTALFTDRTFVINQGDTSSTQLEDWYWSFGDGDSSRLPSPTHYFTQPGNYTITLKVVTDSTCHNTYSLPFTVYPHPTDPVVYNDTTCFGKVTSLTATSDGTIRWYKHERDTEPFHTGNTYYTEPIVARERYYVGAYNQYGCTSKRVPIAAYPFSNLDAALNLSSRELNLPGAALQANVATTRILTNYIWNFGDGEKESNRSNAMYHEYLAPGFYPVSVQITDNEGCVVLLEDVVEVRKLVNIIVPTIFTPNDDKVNDELFITSYNVSFIDFKVFNRWGELVFSANDADFRWDGRDLKGQPLKEDVYIYTLQTIDFENKRESSKGTITIVR